MGVSIGRLREDTVYDYKFVGLSHNSHGMVSWSEQYSVQSC